MQRGFFCYEHLLLYKTFLCHSLVRYTHLHHSPKRNRQQQNPASKLVA